MFVIKSHKCLVLLNILDDLVQEIVILSLNCNFVCLFDIFSRKFYLWLTIIAHFNLDLNSRILTWVQIKYRIDSISFRGHKKMQIHIKQTYK